MQFNPTRLSIARKRRMLNKKGFAELAGVTPHTITRCENGQTEPSEENVRKFAEALNFPVEFFYSEGGEEPLSANFRSHTNMSASIRDAAYAAGSVGFMVSDWVEQKFDLPMVNVPDLHVYSPETAARTLRQEWGLGEKPISNMIHLLESKGVRVFSLTENTAKLNAFSLWRDAKPYVFLNTFKSAENSRFDAAHELGHLVLHQDGGAIGRVAETEANQFASAFLMPRSDLLATLPRAQVLEQLIKAKSRWRVSLAALNYRSHKIGLISDWRYRDFCIEISKRGFRKSEPDGIDREKSVVWGKVLKLLWQERTTQKQISNELHIPESELNGLIFGILTNGEPNIHGKRENFSLVVNEV